MGQKIRKTPQNYSGSQKNTLNYGNLLATFSNDSTLVLSGYFFVTSFVMVLITNVWYLALKWAIRKLKVTRIDKLIDGFQKYVVCCWKLGKIHFFSRKVDFFQNFIMLIFFGLHHYKLEVKCSLNMYNTYRFQSKIS